jgi:hypothetical protein
MVNWLNRSLGLHCLAWASWDPWSPHSRSTSKGFYWAYVGSRRKPVVISLNFFPCELYLIVNYAFYLVINYLNLSGFKLHYIFHSYILISWNEKKKAKWPDQMGMSPLGLSPAPNKPVKGQSLCMFAGSSKRTKTDTFDVRNGLNH